MRTLPYLSLLALVVLPACGSSVIDPSSDYTLRLAQSGGFAGVDQVTTIDSAKKTISFQPSRQEKAEQDDLSDAELRGLGKVLQNADVPGAEGSYRCSDCADEFVFDLDLESQGSTYHVTWDDIAGEPEDLHALSLEVGKLQAAHFSQKLGD